MNECPEVTGKVMIIASDLVWPPFVDIGYFIPDDIFQVYSRHVHNEEVEYSLKLITQQVHQTEPRILGAIHVALTLQRSRFIRVYCMCITKICTCCFQYQTTDMMS